MTDIPDAPETTPMLPPDEESDPSPPIPRGKAQIAVTAAVLDVLSAVARLEAVSRAVARALDATSSGGAP